MIYLLPEDLRGFERLAEIKGRIADPALRALNCVTLEGQDLTPQALLESGVPPPFLADRRVVVVRGLLARFAVREGRTTSRSGTDGAQETLAQAIRQLPTYTELVLMDSARPPSQGPLADVLREVGAERLPPMDPRDLPRWIQQRVAAKRGSMSPSVASRLAAFATTDLQALDGELDKLVTYTDGAPITWEAVEALVPQAREARIFALVDATAEGNARAALDELHRLLAEGAAIPQLLGMLVRQFRMLVQWRDLAAAGRSVADCAREIGVQNFVAQRLARQAARYVMADLQDVYRKLLELDLGQKTGRLDPVVAMELLIVELARRRRDLTKGDSPGRLRPTRSGG